jgi:hypothetical protein
VLVELDLFSGRPNPRWELAEASVDQLRRILGELEPTTRPPVEPPGLGYRGFRFTDESGTFRAFGGFVTTPGTVLSDPGHRVERFLLDQLPAEFDPLRPVVAAELRGE